MSLALCLPGWPSRSTTVVYPVWTSTKTPPKRRDLVKLANGSSHRRGALRQGQTHDEGDLTLSAETRPTLHRRSTRPTRSRKTFGTTKTQPPFLQVDSLYSSVQSSQKFSITCNLFRNYISTLNDSNVLLNITYLLSIVINKVISVVYLVYHLFATSSFRKGVDGVSGKNHQGPQSGNHYDDIDVVPVE